MEGDEGDGSVQDDGLAIREGTVQYLLLSSEDPEG
jgi:hypothetical protein